MIRKTILIFTFFGLLLHSELSAQAANNNNSVSPNANPPEAEQPTILPISL
jgi:hypothetical protein